MDLESFHGSFAYPTPQIPTAETCSSIQKKKKVKINTENPLLYPEERNAQEQTTPE